MANIVVSMYNFLLKSNNINSCPPFYESFIEGLKNAGNTVLCFQFNKILLKTQNCIPDDYLKKIKAFNPDIFIFFNNQFWDITQYFDAPIIIYDVDSINAFYNINKIKEDKERYRFIVNQKTGIDFIKNSIDAASKDICYVHPFTELKTLDIKQNINISFCGTNWFYSDFNNVINFTLSEPSADDLKAAKKVYDLFIENPLLTSEEIYSKFDIKAETKLHFDNLFFYACRVSGINRLRILSEIADLGLEIRGQYWILNDPSLAAFPEILLSCSNKLVDNLETSELFFNSSKISLNTKHIQAKSGFSWRVCDILATNSCLLTQPASDLIDLGFTDIPTFTSPAEAREQCIRLLKNENLRKDIVAHSQEIINKKHRFKHILPLIEDFAGVTMHSENEGTLEIIPVFDSEKPPFPTIPNGRLSFKGKVYRKIARYFYNRMEYK